MTSIPRVEALARKPQKRGMEQFVVLKDSKEVHTKEEWNSPGKDFAATAATWHSKIEVFQAEPEATTQHASSHDIYINQTALIRSKLGIYLYCVKRKNPPQSKAELEATAPVPACKSYIIILERSTKYLLPRTKRRRTWTGRSTVITGYSNQRLCERFDRRNVHLWRSFEP